MGACPDDGPRGVDSCEPELGRQSVPMYPRTLALVDDDHEYSDYLAQHLRAQGIDVHVFGDSNLLLASADAYDFGFYLLDLMLPGVDGVELIKILRLRTAAGVVVVSGRASQNVFASVVKAGADMYLAKPVQFEQVLLTVEAIHRRSGHSVPLEASWKLDRQARDLVAPDGARVALSDTDMTVMDCLVEAQGGAVSRETLSARLGYAPDDSSTDALNATIFRLRRRIERATPLPVPLQAKSRVGYLFRAKLTVI
jgi:two-component system, OmpR family, response regulator